MQLNKFLWDIYKKSEQGQKAIKKFTDISTIDFLYGLLVDSDFDIQQDADTLDDLTKFCTSPVLPEQLSSEEAEALFTSIITEGFSLTYEDGVIETIVPSAGNLLNSIPIISSWLYFKYPDHFKPYFFTNRFYLLTRIADTFGIELPEVPLKRYKEERLKYYIQLCKVFSDFQTSNNLTAQEFCAFLYDFAPNYISENQSNTNELPQPTQIWMIGGDKSGSDFAFLDNPSNSSHSFWQGNEDTKKGDILVMYCLAPRSYIHSIWRATADGIADPFFHYYSSIYIGYGQKIEPITLNDLKSDPHFSRNPLVRKNLQGVSGYQLSNEDYKHLQKMMIAKGDDIGSLPQLYSHTFELNKDLANEREVEIVLIEPLLIKLGYSPSDWVRQLTVRMGRGERNFPDYAFLTDKTKNYEKASLLVESKFWIKNNRELEETFKQVWSYGQRLNAKILVIADKDAIWIYEKINDSYDRTKYIKKFWRELENPDHFSQIKLVFGRT